MPIQQLRGSRGLGTILGEGLGSGISHGVNQLLDQKIKDLGRQQQQRQMLSGLQYLYPDASAQELQSLAAFDPRILQGALKGREGAMRQRSAGERSNALLNNLNELESTGSLDKTFGLFGGGDKDTYDVYAKELAKQAKLIDPTITIPNSKMDRKSRREALDRIQQVLAPYQGAPMREIGAQQNMQKLPPQLQQLTQLGQGQAAEQPAESGEEGIFNKLLRNLATIGTEGASPLVALGSRALGAASPIGYAPAASDALQLAESLPFDLGSAVVGLLPGTEEQKKKTVEAFKKLQNLPGEKLSDYLPTSSNIKKLVSMALPDGYFAPRSEGERIIQDSANKFLNLYAFGKLGITPALVATATGIGAKEYAKSKGYGPLAQNAAEFIFTMMPGALYNNARGNLRKTASDAYNKFADANSKTTIKMPDVQKEIQDIAQSADKYKSISFNKKIVDGMRDLESQFAKSESIDLLKKKIAEGATLKKINPQSLLEPSAEISLKNAINNKRAVWDMINDFSLDKNERRILTELASKMDQSILSAGKSQNIPHIADFQKANQIWSGLRQGESIVNTLKEQVKDFKPSSVTLRTLLGKFPEGAYTAIGLKLAGVPYTTAGAIALGGQELLQTYRFLSKTPGAWKELGLAAKSALESNSKASIARLAQMDKKAQAFEANEERRRKRRASAGLK